MLPRSFATAASLLLAFGQSVAASSSSSLRHTLTTDIDHIHSDEGRHLEVDLTACYEDMVSVANKHNIMTKDAFYYFADIMSNQWFSDNGVFSYDELTYDMKFAFVTLACECHSLGGPENCCQAHRASLDVDGANGQEVSQEQTDYLVDICTTTSETIGPDRTNPTPAELPTTAPPTPSTAPVAPPKPDPIVDTPTAAPVPSPSGGLSIGGSIGIAMGAAAVLALLLLLLAGRKGGEEKEDENLDDIEADDLRKVDVNADLDSDAPGRSDSPDGTKSMTTNSVMSGGNSTIVTSSNANMLPGMDDSENENELFTDGHPNEIPSASSSISRYVVLFF